MKINYQDLRAPRRVPLHTAVPIDTPMLVQLDPANTCNLRCDFCPTGYRSLRAMRNNGIMKWDLYVKIIDGFKNMPHRIKQLTFCKDGEPLINPNFSRMARLARDADIADRYWLKTNGILLSPPLIEDLATCGLDLIGVSVKQFSSDGYKRVAGVSVNYDRLIKMVELLHQRCSGTQTKVYVSTLNNGLTPAEIDQFYADFDGKCDYIAIEDLHGWSMSEVTDFTHGNEAETTVVTPKVACPWPLFTMGINFDGQVSACQEDWSMKNIIGDLNTQTVSEVWHSAQRKQFIRTHLEGNRADLPACAHCKYIEFSPDNIDDHRDEILRRL